MPGSEIGVSHGLQLPYTEVAKHVGLLKRHLGVATDGQSTTTAINASSSQHRDRIPWNELWKPLNVFDNVVAVAQDDLVQKASSLQGRLETLRQEGRVTAETLETSGQALSDIIQGADGERQRYFTLALFWRRAAVYHELRQKPAAPDTALDIVHRYLVSPNASTERTLSERSCLLRVTKPGEADQLQRETTRCRDRLRNISLWLQSYPAAAELLRDPRGKGKGKASDKSNTKQPPSRMTDEAAKVYADHLLRCIRGLEPEGRLQDLATATGDWLTAFENRIDAMIALTTTMNGIAQSQVRRGGSAEATTTLPLEQGAEHEQAETLAATSPAGNPTSGTSHQQLSRKRKHSSIFDIPAQHHVEQRPPIPPHTSNGPQETIPFHKLDNGNPNLRPFLQRESNDEPSQAPQHISVPTVPLQNGSQSQSSTSKSFDATPPSPVSLPSPPPLTNIPLARQQRVIYSPSNGSLNDLVPPDHAATHKSSRAGSPYRSVPPVPQAPQIPHKTIPLPADQLQLLEAAASEAQRRLEALTRSGRSSRDPFDNIIWSRPAASVSASTGLYAVPDDMIEAGEDDYGTAETSYTSTDDDSNISDYIDTAGQSPELGSIDGDRTTRALGPGNAQQDMAGDDTRARVARKGGTLQGFIGINAAWEDMMDQQSVNSDVEMRSPEEQRRMRDFLSQQLE